MTKDLPTNLNLAESADFFLEELAGEMREVSGGVRHQIDGYTQALAAVSERRHFGGGKERESIAREIAFFKFKLWQFVDSRDRRIEELKSPEVLNAEAIKDKIYPDGRPNIVCCVDGRVLPKVVSGMTGYAVRTPAGDLPEAVRVSGEHKMPEFSLEEGQFSDLLDDKLKSHDTVVEMLDSHVECGAGCANYAHNHSINLDAIKADKLRHNELEEIYARALVVDVKRKKDVARATEGYVKGKYGDKKKVINIQYTYDPVTGYSYMGLEKDECLGNDTVVRDGYSTLVLAQLVQEKKVIYAGSIADKFASVFLKNYFDINYQSNYAESTALFWGNIDKMREELLPVIVSELKEVFPNVKEGRELEERALFLLRNAYSGYLHSYSSDGEKREYPYDEHKESVIVITRSEKGPYDRAQSFSVNPSVPAIYNNIAFMDGLVRGNRSKGSDTHTAKAAIDSLFTDRRSEYVNSTVPVIFFERLEGIGGVSLNSLPDVVDLQTIDWSDLASEVDWYNMDRTQFRKYVDSKFILLSEGSGKPRKVSADAFEKLESLRLEAVKLFKRDNVLNQDVLITGRITPVFILTGPNRETVAMLPFLKEGYSKKK